MTKETVLNAQKQREESLKILSNTIVFVDNLIKERATMKLESRSR
jgi:hypothetical protein